MTNDNAPRPRDLALLLLASGDLLPRKRARDQQADRAGLDLKRGLLERIAAIDPEPAELEAALMQIVQEHGPPTGPIRALAVMFREEWQAACVSPEWLAHLLAEAIAARNFGVRINPVANFLQKWFGAAPAPPAHLAEPLGELARLARARPALQGSCKTLETLLVELFGESPNDAPLRITDESAHAKSVAGMPLLRDLLLTLNKASMRRRWLAVCAAMEQQDAELLADAVCKKTLDPIALLSDVLAGRPDSVSIKAESLAVDAGQLATILRLTALPALAKFADPWRNLRQGVSWEGGYCPTCGSWPLLAESRGLEQLRYLRCGLCTTTWEGSRFHCLFCGNEDHHKLGYFHVEGEEDRYRAATCDECRGYVKVVSTLSALSAPQLLVTDLATLHLDLIAAERGFFVPAFGV